MNALIGSGNSIADILSGRSLGQSQLAMQAGRGLGDISMQGALTNAGMMYGTGQDLASYRMQTGRDIANNITAQMNALGNLQNQQGMGMSDLYGQNAAVLAGQQTNASNNMANTIGGYGNNMAGIAMGTGANYNPNSTGQTSQVDGIFNTVGRTLSGFATGGGAAAPVTSSIPS